MRIVKFAVANGIPDYDQFGGIQAFGPTEVINDECIGQYFGAATLGALPNHSVQEWPLKSYRTDMTGQELMDLIDAQNIDIWPDLETLAETVAKANTFVNMVGRRKNAMIDTTRTDIVFVLDALEANTAATAADVIAIKQGVKD